jgi:hypothetical protein
MELKALYIGTDDDVRLLEHGRHYMIRKRVYKNGHVSINVLDIPGLNVRYTSEKAYNREWREE